MLSIDSILGAALIVCGLYMVLWGKSREMKMKNQPEPSKSSQESQSQSSEIATASAINNNNYGKARTPKSAQLQNHLVLAFPPSLSSAQDGISGEARSRGESYGSDWIQRSGDSGQSQVSG